METSEAVLNQKSLLRDFTQSRYFKGVYEKALKYCLKPRTPGEIKRLKGDIAGSLYEGLAYLELSRKTHPGTLLSPNQTLEYFKKLYPDSEESIDVVGLYSLKRGYSSDGLLLSNDQPPKVLKVYEYTLRDPKSRADRFGKKISLFNRLKIEHSEIFADSLFVLVLPKDVSLPEKAKGDPAVRVENISSGANELKRYIDYVFYSGSHDRASLDEVQRHIQGESLV